ncbi:hypothetical protein PO878_03985 [Iamia majanohamensis]|uniref:Uncharacterized protein n=1 Tax=Iamia majanohamensis TaxID=467976 RepID=A0AAF0BWC0_9ACTN|nr:hypothetical protein [Iamia majanohamensis]WCO67883.1 hypothetical protein PO878_03985 [Iamia majanohamensis]
MPAVLVILGAFAVVAAAFIIGGFSGALLAAGLLTLAAGLDEARL